MRVRLNVQRLQELLAQSRLTQNHWALKIGISRGHWSDIVNGKHPYPSPKTRQRMVEVLGVRLEDLFVVETGPTAWHDTDFRVALQDRYLIDRELGQGAMGSVYLARDIARGRLVALKVLAPEAVCGIGISSFLREISVVSRLQHPNILPLFDSGVVSEHPFYVMPWIRAGSLRDRLRRETRLSLPSVVALARGIAGALHHAHAEQVLHCDVKPENILLHGEHAYVMDFGISRILHAEVSEWRARRGIDTSAGTPAYVSPEQANGDEDLDGRTDVYSFGCVVYELLAGKPPFEGTSTESVVARRFLAPPAPLRAYAPEIPHAVADAIARAMDTDRARRPATPVQFAEELARAAVGAGRLGARVSLTTTRAVGALRRRAGRPAANHVGGSLMQLAHDARLTMRSLRRNWRFALAFVLPLALGLGAGATFYSILDHVLYRPPPHVTAPEQLVRVAVTTEQFPDPFVVGNVSTAWMDYEALARQTTTLASVAAFQTYRPSLGRGPNARVIPVMLATASYFPLLGVRPQLGRFYGPDEDAQTSTIVPCVAGDRFWRTELGASREAIGKSLVVGELSCVVVGVAPRGFNGTGYTPIDLWIPLRAGANASQGDDALWTTDRSHWMRIIARPRPGVTTPAINDDATRAYRSVTIRQRDPAVTWGMAADRLLGSATTAATQRLRLARWLVGGAIALVLLVGANLVNLLVARNLGRLRETAIRIALGGSRATLFRQDLLECLALALMAGLASLVVVRWVGPIARGALFPGTAWADGPVTTRIILLALLVSVACGSVIAALTAFYASGANPATLLSAGSGTRSTATRGSMRARMLLVGVQAALSVVLLVASAGFIRSFRNAAHSSLGFDIKGMLFADVPLLRTPDGSDASRARFYYGVRERLAGMPGVAGVSLGYMNPWYNNRNEALRIPGRDSLPPVPNFGSPAFDAVTPDYLTTMRLTMRAGRWISPSDLAGSAPVMVVSESLARLYWPGAPSVTGRCIQVGEARPCREIVGVVTDIRFSGRLDDPYIPSYYLPAAQAAAYALPLKLFIRVRGEPAAMVPIVRRVVQGFWPGLPAADVHVMQDQLDPLLAPWRLGAMAFSALGVVAAAIAMLGLFSVMAYLVAERGREFAIRSALGARATQIVTPVVRRGLLVVGAGALVGTLIAWRSAFWLQPLLFHVQLLELRIVVGIIGGLLLVAVLAALGPARRAATLDPIEALRSD